MSVQRWSMSTVHGHTDADGEWVTYADHVAALAEAEQQFNETLNRLGKCNGCQEDLDYCRAEALREAREAVARLHTPGKGSLSGLCIKADALAAIDALKGGQA